MTNSSNHTAETLSALAVKAIVEIHNANNAERPIRVWKESKAKLIERTLDALLKAEHDAAVAAALEPKPTKPAKIVEPKAPRAKKLVEVKHGDQRNDKITNYARLQGLNAKVLRAKLRKAGFTAPYTLDQLHSVIGNK